MRTRGKARNGSVLGGPEAPEHAPEQAPEQAHEREVIRAFTELHRQHPFPRAARPEIPKRPQDHRLADLADPVTVDHQRTGEREHVDEAARESSDGDISPADTSPADAGPVRGRPRLPTRPVGPPQQPTPRRRGWAGVAERHLSDVLALAGATVALIAPWAWLIAVAGFCLVVGTVRSVMADERPPGAATVATAARAGQRVGRLLRPRSLAWLPVITARTVLAAILIPGVVAGAAWLADQGGTGVFAAVRLAAWGSGFRIVAAALCLMMLAGVGDGRGRRAEVVRRALARWPDGAVVALAAGALCLAAAVIVAGPRLSGGPFTGADGLAWAPARVRPAVDDLRDEIVDAELRAVASCLTERQGMVWSIDYSADNPLDAPDVARLSLGRTAAPEPAALVTAVVAVDNQLASWVEVVEVAVGDAVVLTVDREALEHDGVRVEAATIDAGVVTGSELVAAGVPGYDRTLALTCSAGPVL